MTEAKSTQPLQCPYCKGTREQCEANEYCQYRWPSRPPKPSGESAQPQLPPRPETYMDRTTERIKPGEDAPAVTYITALEAENESLKASLDEARAGCVAWECAVSSLKAHLQDRIAMKDESRPDIYLSILQSDVANVARDTKQIRDATWHRERLYAARAEKAEAERDQALGVIREYRWSQDRHRDCGPVLLNDDDRCPTCIKADELLLRKEK